MVIFCIEVILNIAAIKSKLTANITEKYVKNLENHLWTMKHLKRFIVTTLKNTTGGNQPEGMLD